MKKLLEFLVFVLLLACAVLVAKEVNAETPHRAEDQKQGAAVAQPSGTPSMAELVAYVAREFGDGYKLTAEFPPMFGDFDGDGRQDLALVATGDNPLMNEASHNYKTLDPYNSSFGYGDPRVTLAFNTSEGKQHFLLIAHNWQKPTRKFVLVNVPFKQLRPGHMMLKKKPVDAIESIDTSGIQGAIYFDGKKYKWEVIGSELEQRNP